MPKQEQPFLIKFLLPMISVGIVSMVGMQVKLIIDVTTVQAQIQNLKEVTAFGYSKNDAVADQRVQEAKDSGLTDRMNSIANRINNLEERVSKILK